MKLKLQIDSRHGVFFLGDPVAEIEFPEDVAAGKVTYTETCVAIQVPNYVDGQAEIVLSDKEFTSGAKPLFSGSLQVPSKVLTLSSASFDYCQLPLTDTCADIDVWYYGATNDKPWVRVRNVNLDYGF